MKTIKTFNNENASPEEIKGFDRRYSVRAVCVDQEGKIALIYASKLDYYALPGGGIEAGETPAQAVVRECKEEVGCDMEVVSELGTVLEVRKSTQKVGEIHGFLLKVVGEKGSPLADDLDTVEEGFVVQWETPERVKEIFEHDAERQSEEHKHIAHRSLAFIDFFLGGFLNSDGKS